MAAKTKPSKRDAILDAMLDLVVERGFHDAPMSLLAQRSEASAGVIYHYFAGKEEIIQALYERISALKIQSFLEGSSPDLAPAEAFVQFWLNMYAFYRKHPKEMRFYEQYENAGFVCKPIGPPHDERTAAFAQRFTSKSKGGVLNEWPDDVVQEMTLGLIARLARLPRKLAPAVLRDVAEKTWNIVKA
jgi:AcrR family transcriptional regulator